MNQPDFQNQVILQNIFLLENLQGGIVYSDFEPPFALRYVTEGMEHISGYTREELLNMEQMDLVYEEDIEHLGEEVERQFGQGDTFEVAYRLKRKDGSLIHILDRAKAVTHDDGKKYIHCLLTDITDLKLMEQARQVSQEKYKIAMQQSGYAILEYNPESDLLKASDNYSQIFGVFNTEGTLDSYAQKNVAQFSTGEFVQLFQEAVQEKKNTSGEFKILSGNNCYLWCLLYLTALVDAYGTVYTVIGCLQNIDRRKKRMEELINLSQRDGLTNTYNRTTMEGFVNQHLNSEACGQRPGALFVLDIDNFKNLNDTLGHDVGDEALIKVVDQVQVLLQPKDLVGRLGGDEFLIFLPDAQDEESVSKFANSVVESVRVAFLDTDFPITVSIGCVLSGPADKSFKALYKQADLALYKVKKQGRNHFALFSKIADSVYE